jgi:hypothetical protein
MQEFGKIATEKNTYHSIAGFEVVPFNYGLSHVINETS